MKQRKTNPPQFTDRERILTTVIERLSSAAILCPRGSPYNEASWKDASFNCTHTHFALYRKSQKGDLVIGRTGSISSWKIGFYVEPLGDTLGGAVIRDIGSARLCNYSNEEFTPIVGLTKTQLLEGDAYKMYAKVLQAFRKGGEYSYRFGGVDFHEDATVTIWVREVFGGRLSNRDADSQPFAVKMPWTKKTSVKAILATMREQGYGTRKFEPGVAPEPVQSISTT